MVEFDIHYSIVNKYDNPVRKASYQLLVMPYRIHEQKILKREIACSPNVKEHLSTNIFGFETIHFYIDQTFREFKFEFFARIRKNKINPYNFLPFPVEFEQSVMENASFYIDYHLFLTPTSLTKLPVNELNQFPEFLKGMPVFDYLLKLNSFVYEFLNYVPDATSTETTIDEIIALKKGVCQDYAHLFIAIARVNKIPTRYVSGYLNQGVGFQGDSQLHAWVEAFLPGLGWLGLDPTNNLLADENYIKIAHGTDYNDCTPIKGVLVNTGDQKSKHSVIVTNQ